ncbi:hypothetical protein Purlil1_13159 [Purpureocillium lilacinum]|uniref:Uncharacterized protein n=1 Tax=Purpureocillium lilacinum TaxID=33203 RepID=A0ABR0BF19_PURLI|nr:hypothetical protein Purlil1_13159 [Purpureocillium lilacinum]
MAEGIAARVVDLMVKAEKEDNKLHTEIDKAVKPTGWTETLARHTLEALQAALKEGREKMGPALAACYDRVVTAAREEFDDLCRLAKEHPRETAATVLLTVVALGVLVELLPVVIELLGFAELGPVEGSFAAWWQSTYGGLVPKGSLFSYLQKLVRSKQLDAKHSANDKATSAHLASLEIVYTVISNSAIGVSVHLQIAIAVSRALPSAALGIGKEVTNSIAFHPFLDPFLTGANPFA